MACIGALQMGGTLLAGHKQGDPGAQGAGCKVSPNRACAMQCMVASAGRWRTVCTYTCRCPSHTHASFRHAATMPAARPSLCETLAVAAAGCQSLQVAESRVSDLTNRLALAEEKVTALKGERSRLYQQVAESSSASRTQVCVSTMRVHWECIMCEVLQGAALVSGSTLTTWRGYNACVHLRTFACSVALHQGAFKCPHSCHLHTPNTVAFWLSAG